MRKLRLLVADDEPLARRGVRQLLAPYEDIEVVAECRNGPDTLRALDELKPDVLFLDVQMPEMSGFEVIRAVGADKMPVVIFVTAHDELAIQAFEAQALDYLVKPLSVERFQSSLRRVREQLKLIDDADRTRQLEALLRTESSRRQMEGASHVAIATETGELLVPVAEIDWIEAEDYYSRLHVGTASHLVRESLTSLESRFGPQQFVRIHRSFMVRLDRVRELKTRPDGTEIVLRDGSSLPVSRRNKTILNRLLHPEK